MRFRQGPGTAGNQPRRSTDKGRHRSGTSGGRTMREDKVTPRHRSTMMIGNQMRLHAWQLDAGEHIIINGEVGVITELHERNNYGQTVIRYITSLLQTAPHVAIVSPATEFQTVGLIQDN